MSTKDPEGFDSKDEALKACTHKDLRQPPHTCPFLSDICDDQETLCTCCEFCEQQCADDI